MIQQVKDHVSTKRAEAGQAIVLIALFMILMLGMLGMAIDGGGLFFLWRDAQGAADSAVLSAAYAQCAGNTPAQVRARGLETADRNGFSNSDPDHEVRIIVGDETTNTVEDRSDGTMITEAAFIQRQLDRILGEDQEKPSNYVWADILAFKPSFFIGVVYDGPLSVNPSAMAHCEPGVNTSIIPGALAYGTCANNNLSLGGAEVLFTGDMHSNSDFKMPGQSGIVFNDVHITYVTDINTDASSRRLTDDNGLEVTNPKAVVLRTTTDADGKVTERFTWTSEKVDLIDFDPATDFFSPADLESLYGPDGTITNYIKNRYGPEYYHTSPPPASGNKSPRVWKGLYYLDQDVDLNFGRDSTHNVNTTEADRGATIITTGKINIDFDAAGKYPWEFFQPIMHSVDDKRYPGFVLVSTRAAGNNPCSANSDAISFGQQMDIKNLDWTVAPFGAVPLGFYGVIYASDGNVNASAAHASYRGAVIGRMVTLSMSRGYFRHDPSLIPPSPPSINNVSSYN